jgi:hypothetical protein
MLYITHCVGAGTPWCKCVSSECPGFVERMSQFKLQIHFKLAHFVFVASVLNLVESV